MICFSDKLIKVNRTDLSVQYSTAQANAAHVPTLCNAEHNSYSYELFNTTLHTAIVTTHYTPLT
jgi:hypothetical protein